LASPAGIAAAAIVAVGAAVFFWYKSQKSALDKAKEDLEEAEERLEQTKE
jgi:Flp pilus assembly protein TadB